MTPGDPAGAAGGAPLPARAADALDGAELAARYLDLLARLGVPASDLAAPLVDAEVIAKDNYLPRPLFLGAAECARLHSDVEQVRLALASLPDRVYGGDFAAFASAAGLTEPQVRLLATSAQIPAGVGGSAMSGRGTSLARADLYLEKTGFRLLEMNFGSAVAGVDSGDVCRAMLRHPVLAAFAREHGLGHVDTMSELLRLVFAETGAESGSPSIAIIDWPEHFAKIGGDLRKIADRWRSLGLDARAGHLGQLEAREGRVWLDGQPVDIVFRLFILEQLLHPDGPALIGPVLEAASRGEVAVFTPLESEAHGSKTFLAVLSDPATRALLTPAQQAAVEAILPWTRRMAPGPVALEDGREVDLLDYALTHPDDLALKPALLHGGQGVVAGWDPAMTMPRWRRALESAMGGQYVIQRRIRPQPELCPSDGGELVPWTVTWGAFSMGGRYGGIWTRAFRADSGRTVQQVGAGAYLGACLSPYPAPTSAAG